MFGALYQTAEAWGLLDTMPLELAAGTNLLRLTTDGYTAPNDLDPNTGDARELSVSLGVVRVVGR